MRAVYVGLQATVPMYTVVIRKCYGMAGMGDDRQERARLQDRVAVGRMGLAADRRRRGGGVPARDRSGAPTRRRAKREIEAELRAMASPFRTAEAFGVEEIIDPRETRPYLCRFIDAAQGKLRTSSGRRRSSACGRSGSA